MCRIRYSLCTCVTDVNTCTRLRYLVVSWSSRLFQRDDMEAIPGYLSLHQNADLMTLKWTPNQLMNGSVGDLDYERRCKMIHLQSISRCGDCVKACVWSY